MMIVTGLLTHTPFPYIPHPIHRSLNDKYNDDDWGKDDDDDDTWWWWQPWIVTIPWSTVTSIIDKDTEPVP